MQPSSARRPGGVNPWWFASTFILLYLYYGVFAFLFSHADDQLPVIPGSPSHLIGARLTNLVLIGLLGVVLLLRKSVAIDRSAIRSRRWALAITLAISSASTQAGGTGTRSRRGSSSKTSAPPPPPPTGNCSRGIT